MAPKRPKADDACCPWSRLTPHLLGCIADNLHPNEAACNLRFVDKATAAALRHPKYITIRLSQPVPHHAFARQWGAGLHQRDRATEALRQLTQQGRIKLLRLTAASGSVDNLELLTLSTLGSSARLMVHAWEAAAAADALGVCRHLKRLDLPCPYKYLGVVEAATGAGQQRMSEWLLANGFHASWASVGCAARGGHVQLLEWLIQRLRWSVDPGWLVDVAAGCDLATLQRLYAAWVGPAQEAALKDDYGLIVAAAASSPTPDWRAKVEWLEGRGRAEEKTRDACLKAAKCLDARERLVWLRQRGYPVNGVVLEVLARRGNAAALQHLLSEGELPEEGAAHEAAAAGHVGVLEVLLAAGQLPDLAQPEDCRSLVAAAARGGHLAAVKWVFEKAGAHQDLLGDIVSEAAARSGSLELMSWLHERGCQWTERAITMAALAGCEAALEQLVAWGCPMPADGGPYRRAIDHEDFYTLCGLKRLGCPWGPHGDVFVHAVRLHGIPLQLLRLLLDLGCPVDWQRAVETANMISVPDLINWVLEHRS